MRQSFVQRLGNNQNLVFLVYLSTQQRCLFRIPLDHVRLDTLALKDHGNFDLPIFFICQAFMNLCFFSLAKILIILLVPPRERPQDHQCQQRVLPHNRVWETSKLLFFILFLMFFLYTFQLFFCSQCVNGMCQAPSSGVCSPTSPGGSCSNANERVIVA